MGAERGMKGKTQLPGNTVVEHVPHQLSEC